MNRNPNLRESYLDGEKLFRKYFEMGEARSTVRLATWAVSIGMARPVKKGSKNNKHGLPVMGVWKAMWRWATVKENFQAAWEIYRQYVPNASWTEYRQDIIDSKVRAAWQHPTEAKRNKFLRENGWL